MSRNKILYVASGTQYDFKDDLASELDTRGLRFSDVDATSAQDLRLKLSKVREYQGVFIDGLYVPLGSDVLPKGYVIFDAVRACVKNVKDAGLPVVVLSEADDGINSKRMGDINGFLKSLGAVIIIKPAWPDVIADVIAQAVR